MLGVNEDWFKSGEKNSHLTIFQRLAAQRTGCDAS